jgi:hypothetical protein
MKALKFRYSLWRMLVTQPAIAAICFFSIGLSGCVGMGYPYGGNYYGYYGGGGGYGYHRQPHYYRDGYGYGNGAAYRRNMAGGIIGGALGAAAGYQLSYGDPVAMGLGAAAGALLGNELTR